MLQEEGLAYAILPELHLTAALGEHTIHVHLHLGIVDAVLIVECNDAHVVDVKVEWLWGGLLGRGDWAELGIVLPHAVFRAVAAAFLSAT